MPATSARPTFSSLLARASVVLCALLVGVACDSDSGANAKNAQKSEKSIAQALDMRTQVDEQAAAREAFEQEYEAKKKAEAEERAAALEAALDRVVAQPEKPAKTLKDACDDAADAHREMMKRRYAEDAKELQLYLNRSHQSRAEVREKCRLNTNVESANCFAHALAQVEGELFEQTSEIMRRCVQKYGGSDGEVARG